MADRPFAVVGDGKFSGNSISNVGNRTIYNIYPPERKFPPNMLNDVILMIRRQDIYSRIPGLVRRTVDL